MFTDSRLTEQSSLRSQPYIVATVEDSVLRTEMTGFESQELDAPKRIFFFKPMSWLSQIRSHRRDEVWSVSLCHNEPAADKIRKYRSDYNNNPLQGYPK
jgi:hypothetical protein